MSLIQVAYDVVVVLALTLSCLSAAVLFRQPDGAGRSVGDMLSDLGLSAYWDRTVVVGVILVFVIIMAVSVWAFLHAGGVMTWVVVATSIGLTYMGLWFVDDRRTGLWIVLRAGLAVGLNLAWVAWPEWWLLDVVALFVAYSYLSTMPLLNIRTLVVVFCAVVVWDIIGVFGTSIITSVADASLGRWPLMVWYPLPPFDGTHFSATGVGDIVLPGLGVILGIRYGTWQRSLVGYSIGMIALDGLAVQFHWNAMPATMTLCPGVLLGLLSSDRARRDLLPTRWIPRPAAAS